MNNKKTTIFYACLCSAVFLLFCLWYLTTAERAALYISQPGSANTAEVSAQSEEEKPAVIQQAVNINTADKDELVSLEGIGSEMAERIIAYREEKGGFISKEEIMNVKGIGEKTYQDIKDNIRIE